MVWLGYLVVFALGFGLGYAFLYYKNNDNRVRELESHLTALQGKYESYQHAVTGHFAQTAQLVNNLADVLVETAHDHRDGQPGAVERGLVLADVLVLCHRRCVCKSLRSAHQSLSRSAGVAM